MIQEVEGHNEVSLEPSVLQAKQVQFPQPSLIGEVLQPPDHLNGPPLDPLQESYVLPVPATTVVLLVSAGSVETCPGNRWDKYLF